MRVKVLSALLGACCTVAATALLRLASPGIGAWIDFEGLFLPVGRIMSTLSSVLVLILDGGIGYSVYRLLISDLADAASSSELLRIAASRAGRAALVCLGAGIFGMIALPATLHILRDYLL